MKKTWNRRPEGIKKNIKKFGYKYTEEEAKEIEECLNLYKEKNGYTTSKALYEIITKEIKK